MSTHTFFILIRKYYIKIIGEYELEASLSDAKRSLKIDPITPSWIAGTRADATSNDKGEYVLKLPDYKLQIKNLHQAQAGNYNFQIKWTLTSAPS